jgi:hypothetical protein
MVTADSNKKIFPSFGSAQVVQKRSILPTSLVAGLEFGAEEKPNTYFRFRQRFAFLAGSSGRPPLWFLFPLFVMAVPGLDPGLDRVIHVFAASKCRSQAAKEG